MKLKAILAVAALALAPSLHAFTLDFASSVGSSIPSSLIVNVPGYANFSADQVPEPSTSLLGLVGLTGLVIRRRR